jgi:hypothetical protein
LWEQGWWCAHVSGDVYVQWRSGCEQVEGVTTSTHKGIRRYMPTCTHTDVAGQLGEEVLLVGEDQQHRHGLRGRLDLVLRGVCGGCDFGAGGGGGLDSYTGTHLYG